MTAYTVTAGNCCPQPRRFKRYRELKMDRLVVSLRTLTASASSAPNDTQVARSLSAHSLSLDNLRCTASQDDAQIVEYQGDRLQQCARRPRKLGQDQGDVESRRSRHVVGQNDGDRSGVVDKVRDGLKDTARDGSNEECVLHVSGETDGSGAAMSLGRHNIEAMRPIAPTRSDTPDLQ